jgi:glucan phosphoethanolaminetransferase (alkaline phosphatase superfamily)
MLAATLTSGKLALSFIPNVEIVTILTVLYAVVFGWKTAVPSVLIFCFVEIFLYGFSYWVFTYFIYWDALAFFAFLLSKRTKNAAFFTLYAVVMTVFFGVLSSLVDTFFSSSPDPFRFFMIRYLNGLVFYAVQIICNAVLFPIAFEKLRKVLEKLRDGYFGTEL